MRSEFKWMTQKGLESEIKDWGKGTLFMVTDAHVMAFYPELFDGQAVYVLPPGENQKNFFHYQEILKKMEALNIKRNDTLIAIGGGVVGDLSAFCASTYKRGMRLIHVPTTLLAMVDSSIGGKTAINFQGGKNNVGTFYEAHEIWFCEALLNTLPPREWACGWAEVMKYALGIDGQIFDLIGENKPNLKDLIQACTSAKVDLVNADPHDYGVRQKLNFGHTIAHALEQYDHYEYLLHGEAVAMGLTFHVLYAFSLGRISQTLFLKVKSAMKALGLWRKIPEDVSRSKLVKYMLSDKKNEANEIVWFEWLGLGKVAKRTLTKEEALMLLIKMDGDYENN